MTNSERERQSIARRSSRRKTLVRQLADVLGRQLELAMSLTPDGRGFISEERDTPRPGILAVRGKRNDQGSVQIGLELVRGAGESGIDFGQLAEHFPTFGDRCHPIEPLGESGPDEASVWVGLQVESGSLDFARTAVLQSKVAALDEIAADLQAGLSGSPITVDLAKSYRSFQQVLEPIDPQTLLQGLAIADSMWEWAEQTCLFIEGNCSVAAVADSPILQEFGAALIAQRSMARGSSLGRLLVSLPCRGLTKLAAEAPGTVVVPANALRVSASRYDLADEAASLLVSLASHPVVFSGTFAELQAIFGSGQGTVRDPLQPVVRRTPDADLPTLVRIALRVATRGKRGIPASQEDRMAEDLLGALQGMDAVSARRLLPAMAARAHASLGGRCGPDAATMPTFAHLAASASDTMAGVSSAVRPRRSADLQTRWGHVLTDPQLLDYLAAQLVGQDQALTQLVERLQTEILTRPESQPLRWSAQGIPGTGKSESAVLIASRLGVPYVNVDAASLPDWYTASAQLLGSGRGIVGSYEAGRLERAANSGGALVEVSDLDHATPSVRAGLADLCLHILETGLGQTSAGTVFNAANLILFFSFNLPGTKAEDVRRGFGFAGAPSESGIRGRVTRELKDMTSAAFLSRMGPPILFGPLAGDALSTIFQRATENAVRSAVERSGVGVDRIEIDASVGAIGRSAEAEVASMGARVLIDRARMRAAQAVVAWLRDRPGGTAPAFLRVSASAGGELFVTTLSKE